MKAVVFAMPGNEDFARDLAAMTGAEPGVLEYRKFPRRDEQDTVRDCLFRTHVNVAPRLQISGRTTAQ